MHRRFVRVSEVALHGILHDARRRADASVVEIDERAINGERLLNLAPVIFIGRDLFRRRVVQVARGGKDSLYASFAKGSHCAHSSRARNSSQESSPCKHYCCCSPAQDLLDSITNENFHRNRSFSAGRTSSRLDASRLS